MRVKVYGPASDVKRMQRALSGAGIRTGRDADIIIVMGGDRAVRNYFHGAADDVPVIGVGNDESGGFFAQIDEREFADYLPVLRAGGYRIEEVPRLGVAIDGGSARPVLNDVAVFASKSAILMEHTLVVNGDEVWHDGSDGIIISTPIGSSAYSMSAGGPVVFQDSRVFGIISVNSLDTTRRPLIVSDSSVIEIDDVSAMTQCEAVMDGGARLRVRKSVRCSLFETPARIIRPRVEAAAISALAKKVTLASELQSMSPSAKLLLKTLEYETSLTQKELAGKTLLPERTVRYAMTQLVQKGYVKKKVSNRDGRQRIYEISAWKSAP